MKKKLKFDDQLAELAKAATAGAEALYPIPNERLGKILRATKAHVGIAVLGYVKDIPLTGPGSEVLIDAQRRIQQKKRPQVTGNRPPTPKQIFKRMSKMGKNVNK
jgi:hypothetical protein